MKSERRLIRHIGFDRTIDVTRSCRLYFMSLRRSLRIRPFSSPLFLTSTAISAVRVSRTMSSSSKAQQPEILSTEELKTDAKWLKMEKINWKDQDGKEVSPAWKYTYQFRRMGYFADGQRVWEAANRSTRKGAVDCEYNSTRMSSRLRPTLTASRTHSSPSAPPFEARVDHHHRAVPTTGRSCSDR